MLGHSERAAIRDTATASLEPNDPRRRAASTATSVRDQITRAAPRGPLPSGLDPWIVHSLIRTATARSPRNGRGVDLNGTSVPMEGERTPRDPVLGQRPCPTGVGPARRPVLRARPTCDLVHQPQDVVALGALARTAGATPVSPAERTAPFPGRTARAELAEPRFPRAASFVVELPAGKSSPAATGGRAAPRACRAPSPSSRRAVPARAPRAPGSGANRLASSLVCETAASARRALPPAPHAEARRAGSPQRPPGRPTLVPSPGSSSTSGCAAKNSTIFTRCAPHARGRSGSAPRPRRGGTRTQASPAKVRRRPGPRKPAARTLDDARWRQAARIVGTRWRARAVTSVPGCAAPRLGRPPISRRSFALTGRAPTAPPILVAHDAAGAETSPRRPSSPQRAPSTASTAPGPSVRAAQDRGQRATTGPGRALRREVGAGETIEAVAAEEREHPPPRSRTTSSPRSPRSRPTTAPSSSFVRPRVHAGEIATLSSSREDP